MLVYEILFVVEVVYVLVVSLLITMKIKLRKLREINNIIIACISLVPSLSLALISSLLNQTKGLEKVYLMVSSFLIPITFFFVVVIFEQYSRMKEILKDSDKHKE
ncbi:MAG: hypothetical protein RBQ97_11005 [Acholeplasma sp.]|nr:hypothetical protein [Acholeplasma sp.]